MNNRKNIVVISDEVHRNQYGLKTVLIKDGIFKYEYAKYMHDAFRYGNHYWPTYDVFTIFDRNKDDIQHCFLITHHSYRSF